MSGHILHQFRDVQPGEGESRATMAKQPGTDWVVVDYDHAGRGWRATVYRTTSRSGAVLAARAWGDIHKTRRAAMAEAIASGIPFMPKFRR